MCISYKLKIASETKHHKLNQATAVSRTDEVVVIHIEIRPEVACMRCFVLLDILHDIAECVMMLPTQVRCNGMVLNPVSYYTFVGVSNRLEDSPIYCADTGVAMPR